MQEPKAPPHWRREVERSPHNRAWLAVLIGAVATFLLLEVPAIGRAILNDTASEAVWAVARPFGWAWWVTMPSLLGLLAWLWPHLAFRLGGAWHLLILVVVAYLISAAIYLIVR